MKKKLFAAMTAAVISITATASIQGLSASADQTQDNASQETVLNYVLTSTGRIWILILQRICYFVQLSAKCPRGEN